MNEKKSILAVIDIQGKLAQVMYNTGEFIDQTSRLIRGIQALEMPILWMEQLPEKLGPTIPELKDILVKTTKPLAKTPFSAWGCPDFRNALTDSRRERVILCGIETHICVYQTARDLLSRGYQVTLVADAVSSRTEANKNIGIEAIRDLGGHISSVESVLFELIATPEHSTFRTISQIIK